MRNYETKIGKFINEKFDSRMEIAIVTYIIDTGIDNLKNVTEEDVLSMQIDTGNIMSKDFAQALVRTAVKISKECTELEIMEYIRCHLNFTPSVHELIICKDELSEDAWNSTLELLELEEDYPYSIELLAIIPSEK